MIWVSSKIILEVNLLVGKQTIGLIGYEFPSSFISSIVNSPDFTTYKLFFNADGDAIQKSPFK